MLQLQVHVDVCVMYFSFINHVNSSVSHRCRTTRSLVGLQPQALASEKRMQQCIICVISNNSLGSLNCAVSYTFLDDVSQ